MKITSAELHVILKEKLMKYGVNTEIAEKSAANFVQNSLDGVYSHGVNRFPRVISYLEKGYIKPNNLPTCVKSLGAMETWDGNLGMGNSNAAMAMDRAIALAKEHGIGCVALRNTNHWMRGGTFGIQAAKAGCAGICWTNTQPNMPAWGAKDSRIGNNPLVLCVPRGDDGYVLVDGAMAMYSYGGIEAARLAGRQLPFDGGYNTKGELTRDPAEIEATRRVLPIGYWKGSGLSILMDMMVAALSEGNSTTDVGRQGDDEYAVSQMFIALDMKGASQTYTAVVDRIIDDVKSSALVDPNVEILYPSEKEQNIYAENVKDGIPVNDSVWAQIMAL
jgi:3-dehydro-L-gulonate 2-dehydrogenase